VPQNTESLFCVNAPFAITQRDDLTTADTIETASYLTTVLSARLKTVAGFEMPQARCAISAAREIELPKPDPRTQICSGLFQSKRCELILTADALPEAWPTPAKETGATSSEIAGYQVIEVVEGNEKILVVKLALDVVCVSNDKLFLAEVLALAGGKKTASIESATAFSAAAALISKSAPFWSVRLFPEKPRGDDPTSIQNPGSVIGFHDPKAVFIAVELPQADSTTLQIHYASQAGSDATDQFASMLGKMVQKSRMQEKPGKPNREPPYVINSLTCDLSLSDLNQLDYDPMVVFSCVIAHLLGQGLML
jgi:hypothetical protein